MAGDSLGHPTVVSDIIDIKGFTRTDLAYATAATQSAVIGEGFFDVWADSACYIEVSATTTGLTTGNGYLLRANNTISVRMRLGDKLAAMMVTASGTLSWHKIG